MHEYMWHHMKLFWTMLYKLVVSPDKSKQMYKDKKANKSEICSSWFRRVSYGVTTYKCKLKGSMTVEAAFAVPFFVFCMVNLLFAIQVIETSSRITAALHETGNQICSYGYAVENSIGEGCPAGIGSTLYAATSVAKHLGNVTDKRGGIKGGVAGISYLGSSVLAEGGIVKLDATYAIKYPINMGIKPLRLGDSYYGHAWVGYDVTTGITDVNSEDPVVYITPSGSVYHLDLGCSHLNPSVSSADINTVNELRSKDGSKYHPCELCNVSINQGHVYITDYGNRYHSNLACSGIKRSIQTVHLSEVGGRRECMTCGR